MLSRFVVVSGALEENGESMQGSCSNRFSVASYPAMARFTPIGPGLSSDRAVDGSFLERCK